MDNYDDIINLPHHVSKTRKKMSLYERAAQFAPFSALTGYEDSINEAKRFISKKIEISDYKKSNINDKLNFLKDNLKEKININLTYFKPDLKKEGGMYITINGYIKKFLIYEGKIVMENEKIPIENIFEIKGEKLNFIDDNY